MVSGEQLGGRGVVGGGDAGACGGVVTTTGGGTAAGVVAAGAGARDAGGRAGTAGFAAGATAEPWPAGLRLAAWCVAVGLGGADVAVGFPAGVGVGAPQEFTPATMAISATGAQTPVSTL